MHVPTTNFGSVRKRADGHTIVVFERILRHPVERVWAAITAPQSMVRLPAGPHPRRQARSPGNAGEPPAHHMGKGPTRYAPGSQCR